MRWSGVVRNITLLFVLILVFQAFSYFNFGLGFMYTEKADFGVRIGYSDPIDVTFNYFFNNTFKLYGFLGLNTTIGLQVGPAFGVFSTPDISYYLGGGTKLRLSNMDITLALLLPPDYSFVNLTDSLFLTFKYLVPDPPGMRMKDKLYIEVGYVNKVFHVFIGLLEPF